MARHIFFFFLADMQMKRIGQGRPQYDGFVLELICDLVRQIVSC